MRMLDLIEKKKHGGAHSGEELSFLIRGLLDGSLPDEQLAAWLMAVRFIGMSDQETATLTLLMRDSGEVADLRAVGAPCVDKHSTGGVADTTTLILVPLVAACGGHVAKMSGRGLGFTGGTIDKLESIPGFQTRRSTQQMVDQVRQIGCAVVAQSDQLAPADRKLYALRDITGTTDSLPLIASSVMSKKLACGAAGIVLDVKTGSGALMPTLEGSRDLARLMVDIAHQAGKACVALVTDMNQPLGSHVGNALEVREAVAVLQGKVRGPLLDVSLGLGAEMLRLGGVETDTAQGVERLRQALASGAGLGKLQEMVAAQGGDPEALTRPDGLPQARHLIDVTAWRGGFITGMRTDLIGGAAQRLGAGRTSPQDTLDPAVGLVLAKRLGDAVTTGERICTLHVNDPALAPEAEALLREAILIDDMPPEPVLLEKAYIG